MNPVGNSTLSTPSSPDPSGSTSPGHVDPARVDPRGLRFAAALTTAVLGSVLLTQSGWLLGGQTAVFAVGAFIGLRRSPYAVVFARLVRPRIGAPDHTEDARPPKFAQLVGFAFASLGLVAFVAGATTLALVAVGLAFAAAFLNAAFGLCLGCELYLSVLRLKGRRQLAPATTAPSAP